MKRVAGMLLALVLVVNLLIPLMPQAQAATVSKYDPYVNISYDYSSAVVSGTIRYIAQKPESSKFYSKYWGKYENRASYNCSTSCISMALSYIGIDTTPKDILDYNILTVFMAPYGGCTPKSYTYSNLSTAVDNYLKGNGKYSPPVIHLDKYSAGGHYVMLIGRISSNKYQVLDPATLDTWSITINGSTATYNSPFSGNKITDSIDNTGTGDVYQWYNADASRMKDVTVRQGETAKVSVYATGDTLSYTWYYANNDSDSFSKSTLCTGKTYSVEMNSNRDGRRVYCKITDSNGNSIISNTVTLNQFPVVEIVEQPQSVRVPRGEMATVSVNAKGDDLTYEWYYANKGSSSFTKSDKFSGNTYSVEMDDSRDGRRLYCKISDSHGQSVTTDTVTISKTDDLKITKQPVSVSVPMGADATLTVEAEGEGLTYTWYYANKGSSTFKKGSATGNTYTLPMNLARNGRQIYCKITDKFGNSVVTDTVTISRNDGIKITKQPVSVSVPTGADATLTVEAEGTGLTYTWYYANKGSSTFKKGSSTTNTYTLPMTSVRDGRRIYCQITDKYGETVTTDIVTISIGSSGSQETPVTPLTITKQPVSVSVPMGEDATVTVEAKGDGLTYTWYYANKGSSTFKKGASTTNTYSLPMTSARDGRQVYCKITDKYGNTVTTDKVTISSVSTANATVKVTSVLSIRSGAGTGYSVVGSYQNGARIEILEQKTVGANTWGKTDKGWVSMAYVVMDSDSSDDDSSDNGSSDNGSTDNGSTDNGSTDNGSTDNGSTDNGSTDNGSTDNGSTDNGSTDNTSKANATVRVDSVLNIRSGAGSGYSVVGYYKNGDRVEILEKKTVGSTVWGKTSKGWISMDYVKMDSNASDDDSSDNGSSDSGSSDNTENTESNVRTVNTTCLLIRKTASTSGEVVGYLYKGDKVTVTETKTAGGYTWGKISKGWIALEFTK